MRAFGLRMAAPTAAVMVLLIAACAAAAPWETWGTEAYTLEAGEAFSFRIAYDEIPVRSWKLVVDSDYVLGDLHVLRLRDGSLLYFEKDESHHEVTVPWGEGEEISVVLTAGRRTGGVFTVKLMGPPRDAARASYSYKLNRALEAYAAGRRPEAELLCEEALRENPDEGVALVLKAGFMRDKRFYPQASALVARALQQDLPPEMKLLALDLQDELARLRRNLPEDLLARLADIDALLEKDEGAAALAAVDELAEARFPMEPGQGNIARMEIQKRRGRALHRENRWFEAVDVFTVALAMAESRADQAIIYFHMGELFLDMENRRQARDAFRIAASYGLPQDENARAAAALADLGEDDDTGTKEP